MMSEEDQDIKNNRNRIPHFWRFRAGTKIEISKFYSIEGMRGLTGTVLEGGPFASITAESDGWPIMLDEPYLDADGTRITRVDISGRFLRLLDPQS